MGTDLEKKENKKAQTTGSVPSLERVSQAVSTYLHPSGDKNEGIPNASMIYGMASAVLFGVAIYYLLISQWLFSFLLTAIGGILFAYAVFFIKGVNKNRR